MHAFVSSFVAIFTKEFVHMRRDRATLVIALAIPVFQLVLFGFIDQTVSNLPTVVVDQDATRYSRELLDKLRATHTFKIAHVTSDPHAAREDITAGRARVGVVIPPDFHDKRARGEQAKLLVLIDGSDANVRSAFSVVMPAATASSEYRAPRPMSISESDFTMWVEDRCTIVTSAPYSHRAPQMSKAELFEPITTHFLPRYASGPGCADEWC